MPRHISANSDLLQRFSALLAQFDTFRLHSFLDIPQVGKDVFKSAHHRFAHALVACCSNAPATGHHPQYAFLLHHWTGWRPSRKKSMNLLPKSTAMTGQPFKAPSAGLHRLPGAPILPVCRSWRATRWTAAPVLYSSSKCCTTILHAADHFNLFIASSFSSSGMWV